MEGFNRLDFAPTLVSLAALLAPVVRDPHGAFDCATAVSAALILAAQCGEQLRRPGLAARLRQLAAIFAAFDYQMKGEDYIDQSPWPIKWMDSADGILRSMTALKQHELRVEPWRGAPLREALRAAVPAAQTLGAAGGGAAGGAEGAAGLGADGAAEGAARPLRMAIVSVCDYDPGVTPLARLSQLNKEAYARGLGYDVVIYDKAPVFDDPLSALLTEPASERPAAWSKVDALLANLAQGRHDWVMWMDCDSFFMDPGVRLEDVVGLAERESGCRGAERGAAPRGAGEPGGDVAELERLVERWFPGPGDDQSVDLLEWYQALLDDHWSARASHRAGCPPRSPPGAPPRNGSLGWANWLFQERRPHLIASEDGLMLNTGVMLVRASAWSWRFFQHVRWMTFGRSPVTQHPWWEQTAMVYLLQLPFTLAHASAPQAAEDLGPPGAHRGYAPACFLLPQKHLNPYPPLVAAALLTHVAFDAGDFIVSFSGCKIYSSQEVCNQLFLNYFFQVHDARALASDVALQSWL